MVQYLTAEKYYEEIKQVLLGINTRKQLEDTIPELAKFAPETAAGEVTALVPIEQINRVRSFLQSGGDTNG
jgi:predicted aldo/keto reductase-like oxidoreductase